MSLALASYHVALLAIAAAIFVAAAVSDAGSYRIPNYLCALLIALFPFFILTAPRDIDWQQHVMIFALVGVAGFAMFLGHLAGAGDVKLLAAASLWAGPHLIAVLLIVTALSGGILSLGIMAVALARQSVKKNAEADRLEKDAAPMMMKIPVPYGVAIATGGLAMLVMLAQPILMPLSH